MRLRKCVGSPHHLVARLHHLQRRPSVHGLTGGGLVPCDRLGVVAVSRSEAVGGQRSFTDGGLVLNSSAGREWGGASKWGRRWRGRPGGASSGERSTRVLLSWREQCWGDGSSRKSKISVRTEKRKINSSCHRVTLLACQSWQYTTQRLSAQSIDGQRTPKGSSLEQGTVRSCGLESANSTKHNNTPSRPLSAVPSHSHQAHLNVAATCQHALNRLHNLSGKRRGNEKHAEGSLSSWSSEHATIWLGRKTVGGPAQYRTLQGPGISSN